MLDLVPETIHQRVAVVMGSPAEVEAVTRELEKG